MAESPPGAGCRKPDLEKQFVRERVHRRCLVETASTGQD